MAITRDKLVDRIAGNAAPVQPDVKENKGARNHTAANAATAWAPWTRNGTVR
jgi:hypothetical protein